MRMHAGLPADDWHNGLTPHEQDFAFSPDHEVLIVARVKPHRTSMVAETGDRTVWARIAHVEVLTGADETAARAMLDNAHRRRTGAQDTLFAAAGADL